MLKFVKLAAVTGIMGAGLAACESSDLPRAATGAGAGYLIDRATGGDGTVGAAVGAAGGVVCDDVTPQYCN
ncbi:hypothetical protein ATO8_07906 [Roseivivax marinus]|uniref:Lipoprotein n=1 Tax=Roseivivax marinus TaxID=1379903 RepID=W4HK67_9RHOB|nr:hypothetical protein [Roseivivax marinus]ETW13119.1 hypothetical protein ATO8_07906 [Roseivivax marinus]UMA63377.1 hypothetical protein LVO79_09920 [Roseivivax marinus]SEL57527.1 hypothetical protein SAMN05444413_11138 [Roseivivax marinus]